MQEGARSTSTDIQTKYTKEECERFDSIVYILMVGDRLKADEMIRSLSEHEQKRYEAYFQDVKKIQRAELKKLSKNSVPDHDAPRNVQNFNKICHTEKVNEEVAFLLSKKDKYDRKLREINLKIAQLEQEQQLENRAILTKKRHSW